MSQKRLKYPYPLSIITYKKIDHSNSRSYDPFIKKTSNDNKNNKFSNDKIIHNPNISPKVCLTSAHESRHDNVVMAANYKECLDHALLSLKIHDNNSKQEHRNTLTNHNNLSYHHWNNRINFEGIGSVKDEFFGFCKLSGENILLKCFSQVFIGDKNHNYMVQAMTILTNFRLMNSPLDQKFNEKYGLKQDFFCLPHNFIAKLEKNSDKKTNIENALNIISRDGRKYRIVFPNQEESNSVNSHRRTDFIIKFYDKITVNDAFAFSLYPKNSLLEVQYQGWKLYIFDKEMKRQGVFFDKSLKVNFESSCYGLYKKITNNSPQYGILCKNYPNQFAIPYLIKEEELLKSANFRENGKFPILSYHYKLNSKKYCSIWKSSQLKPGNGSNRCLEDEMFIRLIGNPNNREINKDNIVNVHIYNIRLNLNTYTKKVNNNACYESCEFYRNTVLYFMEISSIHNTKESYKKMIKSFSSEMDESKWFSSFESSGWYEMIRRILAASRRIVEKSLLKGISVLVHCNEGPDITAQLISLVQIIIDPYFRTIEGFEVLIEKEWIRCGHVFQNIKKNEEESQIFLQFLDCVHQLVNQYPLDFEFNIRFLSDIAYHIHTSMFGTFLCDTEQQLDEYEVKDKTISLWSYINSRKQVYKSKLKFNVENIIFKEKYHGQYENPLVLPEVSMTNLRLWIEYFGYYWMKSIPNIQGLKIKLDIASKNDLICAAIEKEKSNKLILKNENRILLKRLKELEYLLTKKNSN